MKSEKWLIVDLNYSVWAENFNVFLDDRERACTSLSLHQASLSNYRIDFRPLKSE